MNDLDIKKIRKNLGLTQKQMAEKLGVSPNTIQNWEYGGVIPQSKYQLLGNLLKPQQYYGGDQSNINGDNINGNNVTVNKTDAEKLMDLLKMKEEALVKAQSHIDRLLAIIENLTNK